MIFLIIFIIIIIIIITYLIQQNNLKFPFFQANFFKQKKILENNSKTIFVICLFVYLVTFPLYHPEKAKLKKEKMLAYDLQKQKNDNFYKKKIELDPKNSIFFKNKEFIENLKDDKLFFQFPQRKKKRLKLLNDFIEQKNLILIKLKNESLTLEEKNKLLFELNLLNEKILNLKRYFD